jgi:hypothetical protein
MMHVEGEMLTISEGVSSPPVFSGGFKSKKSWFDYVYFHMILSKYANF